MPYSKMKMAVGLFVLIFFASLAVFGYLLLDAKGVFEKHYRYYFITDSASSLTTGMPVKFSGFTIGSIEQMQLLDDGHVKTIFAINAKNRKWINRYTYLLLKKPLLGSPHIEVLSTSGIEPLKPNSKLPIIITDDIDDLVNKLEPVVDKLLHIITNVETITANIADANSSLNVTMKNLELFSAKLAKSDSLLTSVTGDANATRSIIDSIHTTNKILKDVKEVTHSLKGDIIAPTSASIKELHAILIDVNQKLKTLQPLVQTIGRSDQDVKALQESIQTTIEKTNQLMEKVDAALIDKESKEVQLP